MNDEPAAARDPRIAEALGHVRRRLRAAPLDAGEAGISAAGPGVESGSKAGGLSILVACSGGADSVALLGLLHKLARSEGLRLVVGHVDHGLREASPLDARHVTQLATQLGLDARVATLSIEAGASVVARARSARRDALAAMARETACPVVALGHTCTDQAETLLLAATRGAGLRGLSAMADWSPAWDGERERGGPRWFTRPLLDLTRDQARSVATLLGLPFVDDPTNDDPSHPRVRVRQEVLPRLATINPSVAETLAGLATRAREAEEALALWVQRELDARRCGEGTELAIDLDDLGALPRAVRTGLVRRMCALSGVEADRVPARVADAIEVAATRPGPPRSWDLHPRVRVRIAQRRLWIERIGDGAPRERNH